MSDIAETVKVRLDGRYAGWEAEMIVDPEWEYIQAIQSGDAVRIARGIADCLVSWNFRDRGGNLLPATEEGVSHAPRGAIIQLMDRYSDMYRALPNS